ncbi:MAG: hypothetical protein HKN12_02120 [Gemmatimonadetes bacterium]|nr:hypothetical protein [Gemmatimonadota bacterium]
MRLDQFLQRTGIFRQRTSAARSLKAGLVLVDGAPAKPASTVRAGQRLRVEAGREVREWEVLEVPSGTVPRSARDQYVRLVSTQPRDPS